MYNFLNRIFWKKVEIRTYQHGMLVSYCELYRHRWTDEERWFNMFGDRITKLPKDVFMIHKQVRVGRKWKVTHNAIHGREA